MLEPTEGIRVQVVGKDLAASTGRWDRERTDPGENVYYSITTLKEGNDALVFGAQSRVPVHAREIKLVKYTILPYLRKEKKGRLQSDESLIIHVYAESIY